MELWRSKLFHEDQGAMKEDTNERRQGAEKICFQYMYTREGLLRSNERCIRIWFGGCMGGEYVHYFGIMYCFKQFL